jgi:hypothetical protein
LSHGAAFCRAAPFWGIGGYSSTDIDASTVSVIHLTGRTADPDTARDHALYPARKSRWSGALMGLWC